MFSKKNLESITLILISIFIVNLLINNNLDLYIHPRYIIFTFVLSVVSFVICIASILITSNKLKSHSDKLYTYIPLVLVVSFALLLPPRFLTSATIAQRSIDSSFTSSQSNSESGVDIFSGSSKGLNIKDWARILQTNQDPGFYQNKPAKISGFIYDPGLGSDIIFLSRFVLTCCAIDAQPVTVPVKIENWKDKYSQDDWLEVEGIFTKVDSDLQFVLTPASVTKIEKLENPYVN